LPSSEPLESSSTSRGSAPAAMTADLLPSLPNARLTSTPGNGGNKAAIIAVGALPRLVELLSSGSDEGKMTAAGALQILADGIPANVAPSGWQAHFPRWWTC
jgi:hypothetical protein